ncbi:hypothetical protein SCLCIDRAFT_1217613 [Scleroderma citrinum Foug A]|uniref:Uncharacterized protein n=1 Tax=Scleroderma citrinum Foug A TaxID=1036808 RepID=A0A0C3DUS1_9AGAM|nr:hypothetical protein SCLCIDRAFT_1217613 [Scleroderma citrinum Foug A]
MLARAPEHARSMDKARSESQVCFMQTCLPQWTLHTRIVWMSSRENRVKLEVFRDPGFGYVPGEWTGIDVDKMDDPNCDWRALIHDRKAQNIYELDVNGVSMKFLDAPEGIQLGDYGRFTDCEVFCCEGNIFTDLASLPLKEGIAPKWHEVSRKRGYPQDSDGVWAGLDVHNFLAAYKPLCLSLPSNDDVKTLLASLSTPSTNKYFVTRVIQCFPNPGWPSLSFTLLCTFAKPFISSRNEGTDFVLEEWSGDQTMGDLASVSDADGMKL